jgi:hypothetical protein
MICVLSLCVLFACADSVIGSCSCWVSTLKIKNWIESSMEEHLLIRLLLWKPRNTNMVGCWSLKLTFCFMEATHGPLHLQLDKRSLVRGNIMDIPTDFIRIIIFFNGPLEYGGHGIFKLLRWMQHLHQSSWGHEIVYADRSSEDGQLVIRPLFLGKTKSRILRAVGT